MGNIDLQFYGGKDSEGRFVAYESLFKKLLINGREKFGKEILGK